jgi:glycosyltransferase involved in cell wall biosynthesis
VGLETDGPRAHLSRRLLAINPVDHPGGAETTVMRLLAGLDQRGWNVAVTTPGAGGLQALAGQAGFAWHSLPVGGLGRGDGAAAIASYPRVRRLAADADVVYLNGGVTGRLLPALVPPRRRIESKVVLHLHDVVGRVPRIWRLADLVVAASEAIARSLGRLPARVVYPPVDAAPPEASPPWSEGDGPVVGFIGRVEPRKGPLDLVRAAPAIRRGAPGARVVLVGEDAYGVSDEYAALVAASGEVDRYPWADNAPGLMRHLDVLVLPAYREPFGTVLAEAMAVGTPVVATAVDGLPEVIEDGVSGRLVAPGDPERLAAAVLEVLERRDAMGAAARRRASRFHTERHVAQMEELLAS